MTEPDEYIDTKFAGVDSIEYEQMDGVSNAVVIDDETVVIIGYVGADVKQVAFELSNSGD